MGTKKKFTPEELKHLQANPYTLRVTADSISYFPSTHTTIWTGCFGQFSGNYRKNSVRSKKRYSLFSSFNSTRFHAIRLSKYNCSVRVEDEYHTEHGQAALRRDFNFDSPVTQ